MSTLGGKPLNDVTCKISKLYAMFFENQMKEIFHSSPLNRILTASLSFIQFGQVGKKKMFKQMFDARWTLSVTIAHVDPLGQVS